MTEHAGARFDDLNWGRLNLVSAQDQVSGQHSWRVTYQQGDRVVKVACRALPEQGIPHGIDNDVSSALIDHYMSIGLPEDGEMVLAVSELLRLAGFHRNGKYREMLSVSLDRLHTTSYEVSGGWRDHPNRRWTTAKFHFIESLEYTHQGESGKFDERSMLRLRLAGPLALSLRSGYTKPLNIEFMQSLSRPRTRIIFRLLDAMRYNPEDPDEIIDRYEVGLIEWADQCKLPNTRPDVVRRALEGPHEELLRRGYLRQVLLDGRGRKQRLHYEFAPEFTPINPTLLQRLRTHGVADGVSRQLVRLYTVSVLMARVSLFERLIASEALKIKKTPAHALVHLIKHPDQYPDAGQGQVVRSVIPRERRVSPVQDEPPAPNLSSEVRSRSPEEAATFTVKRLALLYGRKFSALELDQLRHLILAGQLDAAPLLEQAHSRLAALDAQGFVSDLKTYLLQSGDERGQALRP
ncbi:Replication initiator protein A [Deinococcus detaillensis]|uniref:Replication initiator protein A n=1 Tax=Deinococcus detaillensis TaxID=2592048 RepID=A0A553UKP2_9DEIO|nr:replication initiator protein A [Deinococcus detaillensis]TSA80774.1 Replication initiator protein A [Deinococcus detaillensis]